MTKKRQLTYTPYRKGGKFAPNPNPTPAQLKRRQRDAARKAKVQGNPNVNVNVTVDVQPADAAPASTKQQLNVVGYVLDKSGSMEHIIGKATKVFKASIQGDVDNAAKFKQNTVLSTGFFAGDMNLNQKNVPSVEFVFEDAQPHRS